MTSHQYLLLRTFYHTWIVDANWWRALLIWVATMLLRYFLATVLVICITGEASSQTLSAVRRPFAAGEVLHYKVKWSFLRLGTVTIRQARADSSRYLVQMLVQSSPSLPFIDVRFLNQTYLTEVSQSLSEETVSSSKDPTEKTVYRADRANGIIRMVDSLKGKQIRIDSLEWGSDCFDALGLLMFSRRMAGCDSTISLPTLNDYRIAQTNVTYGNETEEIEVAAFDGPVRCRKVTGNAQWVGKSFAGMKGPFRGWFSDDEYSIPVRASVEIFLGSIVLELESVDHPSKIVTSSSSAITCRQ